MTDKVENEHLEFLDDLRTSGVTNMFGAAIYLQSEFHLDREEASAVLSRWMKTFSKRGSPAGNGKWRFSAATTSLNIRKARQVNCALRGIK